MFFTIHMNNQKKILHAAVLLDPGSGINRQMQAEEWAATKLGLQWQTATFSLAECKSKFFSLDRFRAANSFYRPIGFIFKGMAWVYLLSKYYLWLASRKDIDAFVLRYSIHDPFQALFIALVKRPVFFVHHTLEVPELRQPATVLARLKSTVEHFIGNFAIKRTRGIIGVTREIIDYEKERLPIRTKQKKTLLYPNGIVYEQDIADGSRPDRQQWLFVASHFYPWQGLDLLLQALAESDLDIVLHLVGSLEPGDQLSASYDERVVLHGPLTSGAIANLASKCTVGLSSFALDRMGMTEACALKTREYLALGLPVAAGHNDVFPKDFAYFSNTGTDVQAIYKFGQYAGQHSYRQVSNVAQPYIDKEILLNKLYIEIQDFLNGASA